MCYNVAVYRYSVADGLIQVHSTSHPTFHAAIHHGSSLLRTLACAHAGDPSWAWKRTDTFTCAAMGSHFAIIAETSKEITS
jgi:hypothetical protein